MPGIPRVTSIKALGVTITTNLSASDHVRGVIANCAQTLYALRVLRTHGMCDSALQTIFRSVVVAKLLYACSAWWGFINATDKQRVNAFLRRNIRCGYQSCADADGVRGLTSVRELFRGRRPSADTK